VAHSGSSCGDAGSDCDLTETSGDDIGQDGTDFVENTYACEFVAADTEALECADATCNELDVGSNVTVLSWVRVTSDFNGAHVNNYASNKGYSMQRGSGSDLLKCQIGNGTGNTVESAVANSFPQSTWVHTACKFDDTADLIYSYTNGTLDSSTAETTHDGTDTAIFYMGAPAGMDGEMDEVAVSSLALADTFICWVTSCGIRGEMCMCDASTPANYKTCATDNDCQVPPNTTALCTGGTCKGRNAAASYPTARVCSGGSEPNTPCLIDGDCAGGGTCTSCTLPACNVTCPS
jgi:hypothetical protein